MSGFIGEHGLWSAEQRATAERIAAEVGAGRYRKIRVCSVDPQGLLRAKTASPGHFLGLLRDGMELTSAHYSFDSGEQVVGDPFAEPGDELAAQLFGMRDLILVPDPDTFVELPWSPGTGWLLGDSYSADGTPFPLDARHRLKAALTWLPGELRYLVGLELEFYLTRRRESGVEPLVTGLFYQSETRLDLLDAWIDPIMEYAERLRLGLRTIEAELGPGQLEATFAPQPALRAADNAVLFRSMVKQVSARQGLHATFMAVPGLPGFTPSGWHLHQSLGEGDGRNLFMPDERTAEPLSPLGRHFVGGLLRHAAPAMVFTTPTINGYRRPGVNSLAPDRATWADDHRGAMCRVRARAGDPSSRVENRIGEPAANPYLHLAANLLSGLDGVHRNLDPGPALGAGRSMTSAPALPRTLAEAVTALDGSAFFRAALGDRFVDWKLRVKESELARYRAAESDRCPSGAVTDWEQLEYFDRF